VQADYSEIRTLLTAAEIDEIEAHPIFFGDNQHSADAIHLAKDWAERVQKFDADRARAWSDRRVWTEHDLAGALFLRDFLQEALEQLSPSLRSRMESYVGRADAQFRSYTVDDPAGKMAKIADVDLAGRPWWWRRVPVSGPITEDLARW
jgi:hypothetical protein